MKTLLKKYFISGTVVFVPVVATIWILKLFIDWADNAVLSFVPDKFTPEVIFGYRIPGLGLVFTIVLILLIGLFTRLYIGKAMVRLGDSFFSRLPFGRAIYQAIKQMLQSALVDKQQKGRRVVLVEYPEQGKYAVAFLLVKGDTALAPDRNKVYHRVFVPTAPNPTSGFVLIVPEEAVKTTDMTMEDATKFLISGGIFSKEAHSV